MRFSFKAKGICCAAILLCSIIKSDAEETRYSASLKHLDGKYSSIFGIVPKEYDINSKDTLILTIRREGDSLVLDVQEAKHEQILRAPNELPLINIKEKPLHGLKLKIKGQEAGNINIQRYDEVALTEEQVKEASRLAVRFIPSSSPFKNLNLEKEEVELDLPMLLSFLGYNVVRIEDGKATLSKGDKKDAARWKLLLQSVFRFKSEENETYIELQGNGHVVLDEKQDLTELALKGDVAIHGSRKLPDGRIVPFNLISNYEYESQLESVGSPTSK